MASTGSAVDSEDHPDYVFDDADLILLSSDGLKFHIHALVLKLSSSVFRDMITIGRSGENDPVSLSEDKATLAILLDMLYPGRNPPSTISHSELRAVAIAADKYDIIRVTGVLKDILLGRFSTTTLVFEDDNAQEYASIKSYLTASHLGWTSVATELSPRTLSCDLNSCVAQRLLFAEDACRQGTRELLALHRERRIWIYNMHLLLVENDLTMIGSDAQQSSCKSFNQSTLTDPRRLPFAHTAECNSSSNTWLQSRRWWQFKNKVFNMLEKDASGMQFLSDDFYNNCAEAKQLNTMPCCQFSFPHNDLALRHHFKFNIEHVPNTIEGFRKFGRDLVED